MGIRSISLSGGPDPLGGVGAGDFRTLLYSPKIAGGFRWSSVGRLRVFSFDIINFHGSGGGPKLENLHIFEGSMEAGRGVC